MHAPAQRQITFAPAQALGGQVQRQQRRRTRRVHDKTGPAETKAVRNPTRNWGQRATRAVVWADIGQR